MQEHKRQQAERSPRALLPGAAREKLDDFADRVRSYLDSALGYDEFSSAFGRALEGTFRVVGALGARSVSSRRILSAYRKRGVDVTSLQQVRSLPLQEVDRVKLPWI